MWWCWLAQLVSLQPYIIMIPAWNKTLWKHAHAPYKDKNKFSILWDNPKKVVVAAAVIFGQCIQKGTPDVKTKEQKSWDNILNGYFINPKLWGHNPPVSGVDIHCARVTLIEQKALLALHEMFLSSFLFCQQFSHRGKQCPENAHFLWLCSNAFPGKKNADLVYQGPEGCSLCNIRTNDACIPPMSTCSDAHQGGL